MDITTVIVNYQTPDYLEIAVSRFKRKYPDIPLLIIDNGSKDNSPQLIDELCKNHRLTVSEKLSENIFHGPAMDLAARKLVETDFIFFLDSDTETLKSGFLEAMYELLNENTQNYASGELLNVNKRGYRAEEGIRILQTPYMLLKREIYLQLSPFIHHGQPTMFNYENAAEKGYVLKEYPVSDFIDHKWRGTAERFGYGLGIKAKMDYLLNKLGL